MKKIAKSKLEYEKARKRKNEHLIRLSDEEEKIVQEKIAKSNLNFTEYAITMMTCGIIVVQEFDSLIALAQSINKIGVNINQIAHRVNADNYLQDAEIKYIKKQLDGIYKSINNAVK